MKIKIKENITNIKVLCYPRILGYVFNPLSISTDMAFAFPSSMEMKEI